MQDNMMQGLAVMEETTQFLVAETTEENAAQKENAQEIAALEASLVACATNLSTTEYITDAVACQIASQIDLNNDAKEKAATDIAAHPDSPEYSTEATTSQIAAIPTLAEIENEIANVARKRIESARQIVADTRERIEREQKARQQTLEAMHARANQIEATLTGLADERTAMETRARTFLGGDELNAMLGKIHLAFNARQLELEDALATAKTDVVETQEEIQAASVSDRLELQFAEQDLERLESIAPEVAQAIQQAEAVTLLIANAQRAIQDGMLRDAAALVEQLKKANADAFCSSFDGHIRSAQCMVYTERSKSDQVKDTMIADLDHALEQARQTKLVRDLIARLNTNPEQPGAMKRIYRILDEAKAAGVADQIAAVVARVQKVAGEAKRGRLTQARPIADHLLAEGFMPVVSDGRIEAWQFISRNGNSDHRDQSKTWVLDHVLVLRANGIWATEKPTVAVTRQELAPHALNSKWYHAWVARRNHDDTSSNLTN